MPSTSRNKHTAPRNPPEAQSTFPFSARAGRQSAGRPLSSPARHNAEQIILRFIFGFGICGAVAGLLVGLGTYVPTAPAAAIELGLPAASLGGVLGVFVVAMRAIYRRVARHPAQGREMRSSPSSPVEPP